MPPSPVVKLPTYGRDFSAYCRALALADPETGGAEGHAERNGASRLVVDVCRSGVAPADLVGGNWAAPLLGDESTYASLVGDFTPTMTASSVFFRLLNSGALATVPPYSEVAVVTADLTAVIANNSEGKPLKMGAMVLGRDKVSPSKAGCMVVASESLLRAAPAANGLFEKMLRQAAGVVADKKFFTLVTSGLSGTAATSDALADVRVLANAVDTRGGSPVFIAGTSTIKLLATAKASGSAEQLFPDVGLQGGELMGAPIYVSEGCAADSLFLLNPAAIVASFLGIAIDRSRHASVEEDSAPSQDSTTSTGAALVSLWQANLIGLRCVIGMMAARVRDTAIKEITGCAWGA